MLESGTGGVHRHHARTLLPHCPAQLSPLPLSLLGGAAPDSLLDEQLLSLARSPPPSFSWAGRARTGAEQDHGGDDHADHDLDLDRDHGHDHDHDHGDALDEHHDGGGDSMISMIIEMKMERQGENGREK